MTQSKRRRSPRFWRTALILMASLPLAAGDEAPGWMKAGSHPRDYDMGVDRSVTPNARPTGYIKSSKPEPDGFGTYMQMFDAADFLGKRIRFSALVKSESVDNWAGLWMRVDGEGKAIAFDNMQNRAIKGTQNWTRYSVVLNVDSTKAVRIALGVMLAGKGTVWIGDLRFETVGEDVPVTDMMKAATTKGPAGPRNLGFDEK